MTESINLNNTIYLVSLFLFYWMLVNLASQNYKTSSDLSETKKQQLALRDAESTPLARSALNVLHDFDPEFTAEDFLSYAANTYEIVTKAFVAGDLQTLRPLLDATVLVTFEQEIESRQSRREFSEFILISDPSPTILGVAVEPERVHVTVLFSPEVVHFTRSSENTIIDGDPKKVVQVHHTWTFSRQLSNPDQPWQVLSTA
ncbi:Tim44/TimA family putative adaptor protein [Rhizobium leguminosarum]|uniref:Tim44/TimA family putative adaptor protein n=1 Tax=Rhizobium leguminosarum TaxID=384 RepID=UPI001C982724|nr:Tim44/TimA family putative adaptor protein [Rhizobium leguminosarum]MBY5454171.1 Tim44/TimA family putative adaptor protein [Rhizobium leguminosarum]